MMELMSWHVMQHGAQQAVICAARRRAFQLQRDIWHNSHLEEMKKKKRNHVGDARPLKEPGLLMTCEWQGATGSLSETRRNMGSQVEEDERWRWTGKEEAAPSLQFAVSDWLAVVWLLFTRPVSSNQHGGVFNLSTHIYGGFNYLISRNSYAAKCHLTRWPLLIHYIKQWQCVVFFFGPCAWLTETHGGGRGLNVPTRMRQKVARGLKERRKEGHPETGRKWKE